MVAEHHHKRDSGCFDGGKQRAQRVFAILRIVTEAEHRAWAFELVAKQHDQIGRIILQHVRFSADDEFGCELRVLQIGKDQNGKPAVVAKVQAQGIVPFGVRNSTEREKANAEHQNHCGKAK